MQFAGNYVPATQNWTTVQPGYLEHFQRTTKHTTTPGGTQVTDYQPPAGRGLHGLVHRHSSNIGGNPETRWGQFGVTEPMIAEYPAKTAYGVNNALKGWIYVSANHFGWISSASEGRIVTTLIPFSNIVEVLPSTRIKAAKKQYTFQPLAANQQRSKANGFQIFTKDNLVYQFFALKKSEEFFNHLYGSMGRTATAGFNGAAYTNGLAQPFAQAALAPNVATLDANRQNPVLVNQTLGGQTTYAQPIMMQPQMAGQPILMQPQMVAQPVMMQPVTMTAGNQYSTGAVRYANDAKIIDNRAEYSGLAPGQKMQL